MISTAFQTLTLTLQSKAHNHNIHVDLSAPAVNLYTTRNDRYGKVTQGTSFAAPLVAGTAGLMLSVNPCLSPDGVEYILKQTADDISHIVGNSEFATTSGAGRLNAYEAVKYARDLPIVGKDLICTGGIETFTIPAMKSSAKVTWELLDASNNHVLSNGLGTRAQVTAPTSFQGSATLKFTISCDSTSSFVTQKPIWIGMPNPVTQAIKYSRNPICAGEEVTFTAHAHNPPEATAVFDWGVSGGSITHHHDTGFTSKITVVFSGSQGYVDVGLHNDCGYGSGQNYTFEVRSCGGTGNGLGIDWDGRLIWHQDFIQRVVTGCSLYENPVFGDIMFMSLQGENLEEEVALPFHYNFKIYDHWGQERMSIISNQLTLEINVAELENGLYHSTLMVELEGEDPWVTQRHFQITR